MFRFTRRFRVVSLQRWLRCNTGTSSLPYRVNKLESCVVVQTTEPQVRPSKSLVEHQTLVEAPRRSSDGHLISERQASSRIDTASGCMPDIFIDIVTLGWHQAYHLGSVQRTAYLLAFSGFKLHVFYVTHAPVAKRTVMLVMIISDNLYFPSINQGDEGYLINNDSNRQVVMCRGHLSSINSVYS